MTTIVNLLTTLSFIAFSFASENGGYYVCDTEILASDNKCIFTLSGDQPADWVDLEAHNIDRDVGPVFYRGVEKYDGSKILGTSPYVARLPLYQQVVGQHVLCNAYNSWDDPAFHENL